MIDCPEAVRRMWSYLDHSLAEKPISEFEEHLETCVKCCGELEFNRHLRELVAASEGRPPISPEVRTRIDRILVVNADGEPEGRQ
jgi:mycothiol system anti-sigma-R factor